MSIVRINRDPSRRQLNQFGFVWLGFVNIWIFVFVVGVVVSIFLH